MSTESSPNFTDELCADRPSSRLMLLEAWDGLSPETQMRVLTRVTAYRNDSQNIDLIHKALATPNAYVRYVAAKGDWLEYFGDDPPRHIAECLSQIAHDPSPLVRYAREWGGFELGVYGAERFCSLPREQRLALLRNSGTGTLVVVFVAVLRAALKTGVPPDELKELVEEWWSTRKGGPSHIDSYEDSDEELKELWDAIGELPVIYGAVKRFLIAKLKMPDVQFALRLAQQATAEEMQDFNGLSPVQAHCLDDYCRWKFHIADSNGSSTYAKLMRCSPGRRKTQQRKLQLYELARRLVPWPDPTADNRPLPKKLRKTTSMVVPDDIWGTFMKLDRSPVWRTNSGQDALDRYVGNPWDVDTLEAQSGKAIAQPDLLPRLKRLELMVGVVLVIVLVQVVRHAF